MQNVRTVKGRREDGKRSMEIRLKEQMNGIQHIGIPTNDIEAGVRFFTIEGPNKEKVEFSQRL